MTTIVVYVIYDKYCLNGENNMSIKKTACLIFMFCLLICCGPKQGEVERIIEDGVEVVLNHLEPYSVSGMKTFSVEKILTIDTEKDEIAELGLTNISQVDVDSEGKIFIANMRAKENCVFIFSKEGRFISAFGNKGQGPGEFQNPIYLAVSDQDEIFVTDRGKVIVFSTAGEFIRDFPIDREYQRVIPLDKERFLAIAVKLNQDLSQSFQALLCSSELMELKILDSSKIESFKKAAKVNIIPTLLHWEKSNQNVFTGNSEEYEIRIFDFKGNQIRKIRKDYKAVLLSDEVKEAYKKRMQRYPPDIREHFFIPKAYPPFQNIIALGDNWLFVQTYEEPNEGNYIYDIFNSEGIFISRAELEGFKVKFKGDNIYCIKEKDGGYIEFVVYKMIWE